MNIRTITGSLTALKNYSYVNARVRARRGNLITDAEYRKLMKMDLAEIAEFIGKRGYKQEIEQLGSTHEREDLLERAVKNNLLRNYREVSAMAPEPVKALLRLYFHRYDIENMKIILRQAMKGDGDSSDRLVPTDVMDQTELERLSETEDVETILDEFSLPRFETALQSHIGDGTSLKELEDALDIYYYTNITRNIDDVEGRSELFRAFLELEALLKNVSLVYRMKRRGKEHGEIVERLIPVPSTDLIDPEELASRETAADVVDAIRESPIGQYTAGDSPSEVQQALETFKLEKGVKLMHSDQLGVNPVLGFMVCKEIEAQNLRMISRARAEGLGQEFMENNLVQGVAS